MTEEITDLFTQEGLQKLKKGMLVRFDLEGSITELIITSIRNGKVRAKHTKTHLPQDVVIHDKDGREVEFTEASNG